MRHPPPRRPTRPRPRSLLTTEISPKLRGRMQQAGLYTLLFSAGILCGLWLAPDTPKEAVKRENQLESRLGEREAKVAELEEALRAPNLATGAGALKPGDKLRHEREAKRYAKDLKRQLGRGASDLFLWFAGRWDQLLDTPQADDRTGRRAALLALLIGGMASHIDPAFYVTWQADFLGSGWLGELHLDLDGDGLPATQSFKNPRDNFTQVSVCQIAMALNQSVRDAQILVMPEMQCDRPESRMSAFLQGETLGDAITSFVAAVREQKFLVVERQERGMRLVLLGARPKPPASDDL